jgi:hypothetical protein
MSLIPLFGARKEIFAGLLEQRGGIEEIAATLVPTPIFGRK